MTSSIGAFKDLILGRLARASEGHGFRLVRADEQVIRPIPGGFQAIGVAFAAYGSSFEFGPTFAVRLDAAENISNHLGGAAPRYHSKTVTMLAKSKFVIGRDEWEVETDDEVNLAVDDMLARIVERGIPFLDAHRDVAAVDRALNGPLAIDAALTPQHEISGLIVAHLARNTKFDALAVDYLQRLAPNHVGRPALEAVINHLRFIRATGS